MTYAAPVAIASFPEFTSEDAYKLIVNLLESVGVLESDITEKFLSQECARCDVKVGFFSYLSIAHNSKGEYIFQISDLYSETNQVYYFDGSYQSLVQAYIKAVVIFTA